MTDNNRIRKGSLQFYPRVRAKKVIPSVNWSAVKREDFGLLGFIGYKVGMTSVMAKDNTSDSQTKGKRIIIPSTIIECPPMKILSVRFYKKNKIVSEINLNNDKIDKKSDAYINASFSHSLEILVADVIGLEIVPKMESQNQIRQFLFDICLGKYGQIGLKDRL